VAVDNDIDFVVAQHAQVYRANTRLGVPNRISEMSVAHIDPPHPSARDVRIAAFRMWLASWSSPMWVRWRISTTSRSMPRGGHALLPPDRLALGRRGGEVAQLAALLAELADSLVRHIERDLFDGAALGRDTVFCSDGQQLGLITDCVARASSIAAAWRVTPGRGRDRSGQRPLRPPRGQSCGLLWCRSSRHRRQPVRPSSSGMGP